MKKTIGGLILLLIISLVFPSSLMTSYIQSFAIGTTITVTDNGDSGLGTLRAAITSANEASTNVLINFVGVSSITLNSSLPHIYTEAGSIIIDGENQVTIVKSFVAKGTAFKIGNDVPSFNPTNNIIRNLTVEGFENAIIIYGDSNRVENVTVTGPNTLGTCDNTGEHGISILNRNYIADLVSNNILNNTVSCYRKGIFVQNPSDTTISGNTVTNNTSTADLIAGQVFNDPNPCFVAGIEIQGSYHLGTATPQKNYITNNDVTNNGFVSPAGDCALLPFRSAGIILDLYGVTAEGHDSSANLNRIANNEISDNVGDGIAILQGHNNEIFNNHIARNGSVPAVTADDDTGNGVSLLCTEGEVLTAVTTGNVLYRNTIEHNADNGVFVGKLCELLTIPQANTNTFNSLVENVIFENGRVSGTVEPANDDGIGIDLQDQADMMPVSYTTGNTTISENDGVTGNGGNQMIDTPVIGGAAYSAGTWTMTGTTFIPNGSVGSLVELYQVGCASTDLPTDLATCDIDTYSGAPAPLGYGQGRIYLGRAYVTTADWTITVPSTVGFGGGLITSTNTLISTDASCAAAPNTTLATFIGGGQNMLCSSSEFSANFHAQTVTPPTYSGVLTKIIAPTSIPRQGTGTTILSFANTGTASFTALDMIDDLTVPVVEYVAGSCRWAVDSMPTGDSNCDYGVAPHIVLSGFSSLAPGHVVYVTFDFTVPLSASLTTHSNDANISVTPAAAIATAHGLFDVTDLPAATYSGILTKIVAPNPISISGTGSTVLTFTNTGTDSFTSLTITDDLSVPNVTYVASSCRAAIDVMPSGTSNCSFSGNNISLDSLAPLLPGHTVHVTFDFTVPSDASVGNHANNASITLVPTPTTSVEPAVASFQVTAAPAVACETTGNSTDASFSVNGSSHEATHTMLVGSLVLLNTHPTQGDPTIHFDWSLDGVSQSTASGATISIPSGVHVISHVVTDCDGSVAVETMGVVASTPIITAYIPALNMHKTISPNTNLHVGDLVNVVLQVENPNTSTGFTMLDLTDTLTGLSTAVPVCNYAIGTLPTTSSTTCSVTTAGRILLDLSSAHLDPGQSLFIRYITAATGAPAVYHDAVHYNASTPSTSLTPSDASADFTIVATAPGGPVCTANSNVDASFTVNGEATPTAHMSLPADTYTLVNTSTTGDMPVVYRWYVDGNLQAENAGTLVHTVADSTTFTLFKVDCDGSAAMDTLTISIAGTISVPPTAEPSTPPSPSASPSPGASPTTTPTTGFVVEKEIVNPKALYSTESAARTVQIRSTIRNLASVTSAYTFTDSISNVFLPNPTINDTAGGVDESIPGLIRVSGISIPASGSKSIIYTLTVKSGDAFPLSSYHLDSNAAKDDSDFYPVKVKSSSLADNSTDDPENLLDAPDGVIVNLGERGNVVVDLGKNKVLVDGDGDDVALAMTRGKVIIAASQDGRSFERLHGTTLFDLADADMTWARYIKITDNSSDAISTANVDAVCLLNLGEGVVDTSQVALASDTRTNTTPIYIDVTGAFSDPLSSSDCRSPKLAKQTRTIELTPPAPIISAPAPFYSLPAAPAVTPVPVVQLPKTGPEGMALIVGLALVSILYFRPRRSISKVKVVDRFWGGK